jgi:hypothetical protein
LYLSASARPLRLLSVRRCRLRLSRIASDHLPIVTVFEIH